MIGLNGEGRVANSEGLARLAVLHTHVMKTQCSLHPTCPHRPTTVHNVCPVAIAQRCVRLLRTRPERCCIHPNRAGRMHTCQQSPFVCSIAHPKNLKHAWVATTSSIVANHSRTSGAAGQNSQEQRLTPLEGQRGVWQHLHVFDCCRVGG